MRHGISVAVEGMPVHGATARVAYTRARGHPGPAQGGAIMGLPHEAPSGGYEDDSTAPDADPLTDDLTTPGYDGYSHDPASAAGYQEADEFDYDEEDDLDEDDLDESDFGGQAGRDPGAGQARGTGRM
jgi:hypothetical protein